jgi:hypothetical protein
MLVQDTFDEINASSDWISLEKIVSPCPQWKNLGALGECRVTAFGSRGRELKSKSEDPNIETFNSRPIFKSHT